MREKTPLIFPRKLPKKMEKLWAQHFFKLAFLVLPLNIHERHCTIMKKYQDKQHNNGELSTVA